jgi:hypothetical protein
VAVRADGEAVREDDADAEPLDDDGMFLGDGEVVAMAVRELPPFVWRTIAEGRVALSEEGAVATQITKEGEEEYSLTTTGVELSEGKHYWEVELLSEMNGGGAVDIDVICSDLIFIASADPALALQKPTAVETAPMAGLCVLGMVPSTATACNAATFRKLCFLMLPRSYTASTARGYQSNHLSINPNPYRI